MVLMVPNGYRVCGIGAQDFGLSAEASVWDLGWEFCKFRVRGFSVML